MGLSEERSRKIRKIQEKKIRANILADEKTSKEIIKEATREPIVSEETT